MARYTAFSFAVLLLSCKPQESAPQPSADSLLPIVLAAAPSVSHERVACTQAEEGPEGLEQPDCGIQIVTPTDTIVLPGLLFSGEPISLGDSIVVGSAKSAADGTPVLFRLRIADRKLETFEPPSPDVFDLSVSHSGEHFIYFGADSSGLFGEVLRFPRGPAVARTPSYLIGGTDMTVTAARWLSKDSIEVFFQPDSLARATRWVRLRREIPGSTWAIDTITL